MLLYNILYCALKNLIYPTNRNRFCRLQICPSITMSLAFSLSINLRTLLYSFSLHFFFSLSVLSYNHFSHSLCLSLLYHILLFTTKAFIVNFSVKFCLLLGSLWIL